MGKISRYLSLSLSLDFIVHILSLAGIARIDYRCIEYRSSTLDDDRAVEIAHAVFSFPLPKLSLINE